MTAAPTPLSADTTERRARGLGWWGGNGPENRACDLKAFTGMGGYLMSKRLEVFGNLGLSFGISAGGT